MKKGWIITLILLIGVLSLHQSIVMSQKATKPVLLAVYNDTSGNCSSSDSDKGWSRLTDSSWSNSYGTTVKQHYIDRCIADTNNSEGYCCVCFQDPFSYPNICSQLFSVLSGTPVPITNTPIPTNTPWPTNTPTPSPVNCTYTNWSACTPTCGPGSQTRTVASPALNGGTCYGPFQQNCTVVEHCPINCSERYSACSGRCGQSGIQVQTILVTPAWGGTPCGPETKACISASCADTGTGGFTSGGGTGTTITLNTIDPTPILQRGPTPTPPPETFNFIDRYTAPFRQVSPTAVPSPTPIPTIFVSNQPLVPTPTVFIPAPTLRPEAIIPPALANQTREKGKTSFTLNTATVSEITIVANPGPGQSPAVVDKPFLPQEQKLLAQNSGFTGGGLMVNIQQKTGAQFVTRQDELTVKRGNQFFSISNQNTSPATTKTQSSQANNNTSSNTTQSSSPRLEINANNVVAQSSMALSVDPLSGILTVETPTGPQKVSIMPDEALGIILELKALNAGIPEPSILLVSENGKLIYRVSGAKVEKFIGLLPIAIQKQILVSADTGSIIKVELPLLSSILSFFTF